MRVVFHSEAGHNHRNEDVIESCRHPHDASALLCVLADGQGGQAGGGAAAALAAQKCLELASECSLPELAERATWRALLSSVDSAVRDDFDSGFTTLIGLCVTRERICGASCGDSAALLLDQNNFVALTEGQRKNPPLGSGAAPISAFNADWFGGSTLILMSDGVWKFVGFDSIVALARQRHGQELIFALRQKQLDGNNGHLPDDWSVIVVQ